MNNYFIVLSAGSGKRFYSDIPKQFTLYKGKMLFEHSVDKAIKSGLFDKIFIVIQKSHYKYLKNYKNKKVKFIIGGKERHKSSINSIKFIKKFNPTNVYIHDAARPNFSISLLKKLNSNIKKYKAVVPYVLSGDAIKYKNKKYFNLDRKKIILTQTPQLFKFSLTNKFKVDDECSLFINNNHKIKFVKGESKNIKITNKSDIITKSLKYGLGFDVHRLVIGKKLYLGGLLIKSKYGTLGHSDGDPVLHALTDSILGACKMKDIGQKFSNKNNKYKNIRSTVLLKKVIDEITQKNFVINNIDINIITETPKINNIKNKIVNKISQICNIPKSLINIKGKTTEKLGLIGKKKAIACETLVSVVKYD